MRGLLTYESAVRTASSLELVRQADGRLVGIRLGVLSSFNLGLQIAGGGINAGTLAERVHITKVGTVVRQLVVAVFGVLSLTIESTNLEPINSICD